MYRFLFSSKWLGYLLLAAIFATACVFLGRWQMDRRAETLAEINRVVSNYSATPIPFEQARDQFNHLDPAKEWTQVELKGTYDAAGERIVRNRPLNGQPGYEVVVPFRLTTGETVVIDRGWLPIGNKNPGSPDSVPAPPQGEVTAVVRLKHGEPELQRGAPEGQLASIDLPTYAAQLGYPLMTGAYGQLASETPPAAAMPVAFPKPSTDEGTHLSYSLQWFAFGVLMFVGFGYAARQQARNAAIDAEDEELIDDGAMHAAVAPRRRPAAPRKRKKATAEEEEDALLDAQGY
ncbi:MULTISPECIES: SURF1 family cytochrome oxidase biogenesis protein [Arthrobacter]|uniref:SURF1 family cytochrome oxidase biogenesis protein n=1 Tax=Arthrobacter TaxID=1663 RepID=UPI001EF009CB|nr:MULTISPECIES: SURF1 family protein [Arthrobacter]MDP9988156.1 cytochrome oxidase assembly protein ShyY1 [Arthrobacter oryzae]UKA69203.1 SURF1 family protein [Arthrobacter sp. FW306-06-A]UKA77344.1 SURF1 family protein [Arthrobacter sp. FW306-07-I]